MTFEALNHETIGKRIAEIREIRGFQQNELAAEIGVTKSYISSLERGTRKGSIGIFYQISRAMGVSIDFLVTGNRLAENRNVEIKTI